PFARRSSILLGSIPSTNRDTPRRTTAPSRAQQSSTSGSRRPHSAALHGDRNKKKAKGSSPNNFHRTNFRYIQTSETGNYNSNDIKQVVRNSLSFD
uniref:Uncharacterized protein n=1 Tax=Aegilops tauschii subsp. strangulata TaxID=200361 RepID=A0A453CP32_AEGTS